MRNLYANNSFKQLIVYLDFIIVCVCVWEWI